MMEKVPTMDDVKEFQNTLLKLDKKTFDLYKQLAYVIINTSASVKVSSTDDNSVMEKQREFIRQTAGKIQVDEDAIDDLRVRSVI